MYRTAFFIGAMLNLLFVGAGTADTRAKVVIENIRKPAALVLGPGGKVYVAITGESNKDGSGAVMVIEKNSAKAFAAGLDDPRALAAWGEWLFACDRKGVWRINKNGKPEMFAAASAFPTPPVRLQAIDADEQGSLYVADAGDGKDYSAVIFRIDQKGRVSKVTDSKRTNALRKPCGLVMDGFSHLLFGDTESGEIVRLKLPSAGVTLVTKGAGAGLVWDKFGRLFFADRSGTSVSAIPRPGEKPVSVASGFQQIAALAVDPTGESLYVADEKAGNVSIIPAAIPGFVVDETPMPVHTAVAFPKLQWEGWKAESDQGRVVPLRPIVLTHAGDGSNRVFVATQHGVIHVFPNDQNADKTRVFLDIRDRVPYNDNQNEEGFLGLTFHPKFKENGEFFVYYTTKKARSTNVVSRFRVRKDDPSRGDPESEVELLRLPKPFWNHDGGTICFGPDGYLYIAVGDGGAANDPFDNGQNLKALLGKILRIDVDRVDEGKKYAIPKDNPFIDKVGARPEIWAYGLRNVWRMAFDRKTGVLWAGEVGQNLYEEINLIERGGNYGWNRRESFHPFGNRGVGPNNDMIEPIWEYHHDIGKSITGGCVYRGKRLPELDGMYLYADYVSSRIWSLRYDFEQKRVTASRPIRDPNIPVLSFGEDEQGEVYFLTVSNSGQGIHWFERSTNRKP